MSDFDYVVVGAGLAGCVIAVRLSEDADVGVSVLERNPLDAKHGTVALTRKATTGSASGHVCYPTPCGLDGNRAVLAAPTPLRRTLNRHRVSHLAVAS